MTFQTSAPAPTVAFPSLEETAGRASAATFARLSALRRRRVFHPYGASFTGTLTVDGRHDPRFGALLLDTLGRVRVHRALLTRCRTARAAP